MGAVERAIAVAVDKAHDEVDEKEIAVEAADDEDEDAQSTEEPVPLIGACFVPATDETMGWEPWAESTRGKPSRPSALGKLQAHFKFDMPPRRGPGSEIACAGA